MHKYLSLDPHLPQLKTMTWPGSSPPPKTAAKSIFLLRLFQREKEIELTVLCSKWKQQYLLSLLISLSLSSLLIHIPQPPGYNTEVIGTKRIRFSITKVNIYWALSICQHNTKYIIYIISFHSLISWMNDLGNVLSIRDTVVNKKDTISIPVDVRIIENMDNEQGNQ